MHSSDTILFRHLGLREYLPIWQQMKTFTQNRDQTSLDEIWILEHQPVFTQGQAGKSEHILKHSDIPIIPVDRGGQVTYHGPGQLVAYILIDLNRKKFTTKDLVVAIEQSLIATLAHFEISAMTKTKAPGVYVNDMKIASLGLRIKNGCSYHGLSLNIDMDLRPFSYINPCGFAGLKMTQMTDFAPKITLNAVQNQLTHDLRQQLHYTHVISEEPLKTSHAERAKF